jgi:NAD(P)-dependent dehydrogenase (short-subunit alcohol dehydrogenase family)
VAAAFVEVGVPVALLDRDETVVDTAEQLAAGGAAVLPIVAAVTPADAVEDAVAQVERERGPIGTLANVAGVLRTGPALPALVRPRPEHRAADLLTAYLPGSFFYSSARGSLLADGVHAPVDAGRTGTQD